MKPDFPSTDFLCDVIKHQMGTMTRQELRNNWQQGKYPGVNPSWAKWQMENVA